MFLRTNDRIINLRNVSNVNIVPNKNRIVFNLNYNIEIENKNWRKNKTRMISDYVYWDAIDEENLKQNLNYLKNNPYFKVNFIKRGDGNGYININEISSIKLNEKKMRIIFNLSHPVTFRDGDGNDKITSEFVYVNCKNKKEYNEYVDYVTKAICLG